MPSAAGAHRGIVLAGLALRRGFITPEALRRALAEQARDVAAGKDPRELGLILLAQGDISEEDFQALLAEITRASMPPAEPPPAPTGRRIGRYAVLRELGRGHGGVTYEALDTVLDRRVALKIFKRDPGGSAPTDEERFTREARLAASIPPHPHLVSVYDAGVADGERYIALELIRGRTLDSWRSMGAPLWKVVTLLRDAARAVHHAHECGVVHRDLKPGNILVDAGNAPHVTDFGLAKNLGAKDVSLTESGFVVGTPCYMSPEQARGRKDVDRRSDVYSLGVMLYEILTGQPPFCGKNPVETLLKAIEEPVRRPSTAARAGGPLTVDRAIEKICLKALAKNPSRRYPTAEAFAKDLDRWLMGEKNRLHTTGRRRPWLLVLAATVILALGAGLLKLRTAGSAQARSPLPQTPAMPAYVGGR